MRLVIIGDIHGEAAPLEGLLRQVQEHWKTDVKFVFLGDFIDRGPDSAKVLKIVNKLVQEGHLAIMGNHEEAFMMYLTGHSKDWLLPAMGAKPTIESFQRDSGKYPVKSPEEIDQYIWDNRIYPLFRSLEPYILIDGLALTHAPVPEKGWEGEIPNEALCRWNSPPKASTPQERLDKGIWAPPGYFAVCGHTPTPATASGRKPYLVKNKGLYLDCGCGSIPGSPLYAAVFEDGNLICFVSQKGVEPVNYNMEGE